MRLACPCVKMSNDVFTCACAILRTKAECQCSESIYKHRITG